MNTPIQRPVLRSDPQAVPALTPQSAPPLAANGYQSAQTPEPVYDQTRCYSQDEALEPASDATEESTR